MPRSDDNLRALLADLESDLVERKESLSTEATKDRVRQTVCAFANDLPGHGVTGVVFVGVDDSGRTTNLEITDRLLLALADRRSLSTSVGATLRAAQ